jgi:hypothetical protein
MPVTLAGKSRGKARRRPGGKTKPKRTVKRRNAPAASLADPRYRKRVVKSSKVYSRKGKARVPEEENEP